MQETKHQSTKMSVYFFLVTEKVQYFSFSQLKFLMMSSLFQISSPTTVSNTKKICINSAL